MVFRPPQVTKTLILVVQDDKPTEVIRAEQQRKLVKSASNPELSTTFAESSQEAVNLHFNKSEASTSLHRSSTQPAGATALEDVLHTNNLDNFPHNCADRSSCVRNVTSFEAQPESHSGIRTIGNIEEIRQTAKPAGHKKIMHFRLLLDVVFLLFVVSGLLANIGLVVPYIFLPNRGLLLGLSSSQSSWLMSVVGISNIVGRLVFGYIANMKYVNRMLAYNIVLVVCGICSMLSVLFSTFPLQICYSFVFGFSYGK